VVAGPAGSTVRRAEPDELVLLAEIDDRADTVFRVSGFDLPALPFDEDAAAAAPAIFVAGDPPVGFVQLAEVDCAAHVAELAVLPGSMRAGLGSALLERACEWARASGYPSITLTTFADVAWNAPFYARRGFVEVADLSPALAAIRAREAEIGLDAVARRIVMRREL
jgi:GNAT superfamily N-acetyltransferase